MTVRSELSGFFIVFEGIDGSGKSTAAKGLADKLTEDGWDVLLTAEPTHGSIGRLLRPRLADDNPTPVADALLFAADRAQHVREDIFPFVDNGGAVICDRYLYSSLVYQSLQLEGMSPEGPEGMSHTKWIKLINAYTAFPPDVTFLLDVDPETALGRLGSRDELDDFERLGFLCRARERYLFFARRGVWGRCANVVVDASEDQSAVVDECYSRFLGLVGGPPGE